MTRRYRERGGTWGAAANGCGACGTFPAPAADRSPRRGHLNAERSDGAARHGAARRGTAGQGGGGPPGGGGAGLLPTGGRPPAERGRLERARRRSPARGARPLQGECLCGGPGAVRPVPGISDAPRPLVWAPRGVRGEVEGAARRAPAQGTRMGMEPGMGTATGDRDGDGGRAEDGDGAKGPGSCLVAEPSATRRQELKGLVQPHHQAAAGISMEMRRFWD